MVESVEVDASQAITLHLKHYPGQNKAEFDTFYGEAGASAERILVRTLLDEVTNLQQSWAHLSLNDAGDYVEAEMSARHPDLSGQALQCLGNYFTYLMR